METQAAKIQVDGWGAPDLTSLQAVIRCGEFRPWGIPDSTEWLRFSDPLRVVSARTPEEVPQMMRLLEAEIGRGHFAAGFLSYEAASGLDSNLRTASPPPHPPLLWFGIFEAVEALSEPPSRTHRGYSSLDWQPAIDFEEYDLKVELIRRAIEAGDTYQVNFTFPMTAPWEGCPWDLFLDLVRSQSSRRAAYIQFEGGVVVSASPELFFNQRDGMVEVRPMKGTTRRGRWIEEDEAFVAALCASGKERSENVMIVDLMRNDLGKIARTGSVHVASLFSVERYETIIQMVSAISAQVECSPIQTLQALFPSGSVTGAPKIRTMEILSSLESAPRGVYTGAIGWVDPRGVASFSVAIRTIEIESAAATARYGIGSGVTWHSSAEAEYRECLLKARLVTAPPRPEFELLETMLWKPETGYILLESHLERLAASARYFEFRLMLDEVRRFLDLEAGKLELRRHRVRLLASKDGGLRFQGEPLVESARHEPLRVAYSARPVDKWDPFLCHKTTHRSVYDQARAENPRVNDVILWNEDERITEATSANLVYEWNGRLWTPPRGEGLLNGTFRGKLLDAGWIQERSCTRSELSASPRVWLINSVRGWMPAILTE